ncbi:extracellular solute-binding protein [Streptosporangium carneum]|uniref:extracellular solute-binding protein n=1 Tax=Streptosporangium carneum TaxID=47481 RepID=UPI0022F33480|nr:extracellular solute-binding protein [Streptosporangium carneum]
MTAASAADCDPRGVTIVAEYAPQGDVAAKLAKTRVEAARPGLTVKLKMTNTAGYDQLTQQIVTDIAAGARPDVAMVGLGQIRFWADRYQPRPIDPATLNASYDRRFLTIGTVEGKVYVAPFQVSVPVLYTNTKLTKAAGVASAPSTTGELIANARRIRAATGAAPVQVPRDAIADWVLQAVIQSGGATFVKPDGTPGFDDERGRRALAFYERLGAEKLQDPIAFADALKQFGTGRLAYMISTPAQAAAMGKTIGDAFPWTVTAMPVPDGGVASLPAGGNGWMVLSQDACRAAYAGELVKAMLDPTVIATSSKNFSYIPVDKEAAKRLAADPAAGTQLGYPWSYTGTPTQWGGWHGDATPRVNVFLQEMVQRLTGGESVDLVLPDVVRRISSAVR